MYVSKYLECLSVLTICRCEKRLWTLENECECRLKITPKKAYKWIRVQTNSCGFFLCWHWHFFVTKWLLGHLAVPCPQKSLPHASSMHRFWLLNCTVLCLPLIKFYENTSTGKNATDRLRKGLKVTWTHGFGAPAATVADIGTVQVLNVDLVHHLGILLLDLQVDQAVPLLLLLW